MSETPELSLTSARRPEGPPHTPATEGQAARPLRLTNDPATQRKDP
jgi:hypothetical protein